MKNIHLMNLSFILQEAKNFFKKNIFVTGKCKWWIFIYTIVRLAICDFVMGFGYIWWWCIFFFFFISGRRLFQMESFKKWCEQNKDFNIFQSQFKYISKSNDRHYQQAIGIMICSAKLNKKISMWFYFDQP